MDYCEFRVPYISGIALICFLLFLLSHSYNLYFVFFLHFLIMVSFEFTFTLTIMYTHIHTYNKNIHSLHTFDLLPNIYANSCSSTCVCVCVSGRSVTCVNVDVCGSPWTTRYDDVINLSLIIDSFSLPLPLQTYRDHVMTSACVCVVI